MHPQILTVDLRPAPLPWIPMEDLPGAHLQDNLSATHRALHPLPSAVPRPLIPPSLHPLVECLRPWALPLLRMVRWELRPTAT